MVDTNGQSWVIQSQISEYNIQIIFQKQVHYCMHTHQLWYSCIPGWYYSVSTEVIVYFPHPLSNFVLPICQFIKYLSEEWSKSDTVCCTSVLLHYTVTAIHCHAHKMALGEWEPSVFQWRAWNEKKKVKHNVIFF